MPLPPVTTGLVFVLQADALSAVDGDVITAWPDASAAGNDATGSGSPHYRTPQTPAAGPVIRFTNDGSFGFANNTMFNAASAAEAFFVVRANATGSNAGFYQFGGGDFSFYPWVDGNIYDGSFTNTRYSYTAVTATSWHIYHVSHDGTTRTVRIDNSVVHTATIAYTAPGSSSETALAIGAAPGASGSWTGDIAEALAYTRALNSTERGQVYDYLVGRHLFVTHAAPPIDVAAELPPAPHVYAPPVDAAVQVMTSLHIDAAPIEAAAVLPPPPHRALRAAPIDAAASPRAVDLLRVRRYLLDPPDTGVIPVLRPVFTVGVDCITGRLDAVGVDVQYALDAGFTSPTTLSRQTALITGPNAIRLRATADLPTATPIFWRARLVINTVANGWIATRSFTVDTATGDHVVPVTCTVAAGTTDPHLWFITPSGGVAGDLVTVVGHGFPTSGGTVTLAGTTMTVQTWTQVPATATAATSGRVIDPHTAVVDPEHDEVVVTVPDVPAPGGPVIVVGS